MITPTIRPFWLAFAAFLLSLAWLLPNHAQPWLSFHGDAWSATVLATIALFVFLQSRSTVDWHGLPVLTAVLLAVPALQFAFGLINHFGVVWINMAYLMGFLVALLVGASWEKVTPLQCADMLFAAVALAAVASVGLQLHQWLGLEAIGPWILNSSGSRHYANMAQPNQLASLLMLGVLASAWAYLRRWIGPLTATGVAAFLLFGVALTESRTGWLNALLIVGALIAWRQLARAGRVFWVAIGLITYYFLCVLALPLLNEALGASGVPVEYRGVSDNARLSIWTMFIKAVALRPWLGFGWGQLGQAQFLLLDQQLSLGGSLLQAHNLVLDLVLWNGAPVGLAVAALLAWWAWRAIHKVSDMHQLLMLLFLVVLFTHAMLEFPLQYAYFLLPAGLIMGALNASLDLRVVFNSSRWLAVCLLIAVMGVLSITIRDYFRVETSFYGLRFEQRKIPTPIPSTPPDVLALTQWRDFIFFARLDPSQVHTAQDIEWAGKLVRTTPSAHGMYKLAAMFAHAGQPDDAQHWLRSLCRVSPQNQCDIIRAEWASQSGVHSKIAAVPWPTP